MFSKSALGCAAVYWLCVSLNVQAQTQAAHIHGTATLTLALERNLMEIQFETPAANLVGFEHKAISLEEKQAITRAESILKSTASLFSFTGSACNLAEAVVDIPESVTGTHGDQKHDHKEHGHHDDHQGGHHDDHQEHGDQHDSQYDSQHSDIKANYRFMCEQARDLESVSVELFNHFPGVENINAMWVTDSEQGSKQLNQNSNTFFLR